jgi:hypothetical protein
MQSQDSDSSHESIDFSQLLHEYQEDRRDFDENLLVEDALRTIAYETTASLLLRLEKIHTQHAQINEFLDNISRKFHESSLLKSLNIKVAKANEFRIKLQSVRQGKAIWNVIYDPFSSR